MHNPTKTIGGTMLKLCYRQFSTTKSLWISRSCVSHSASSDLNNSASSDRSDSLRKLKDLLTNSTVGLDTYPTDKNDRWATAPYVQGTYLRTHEEEERGIDRVKIDPEDTSIILFPGYGSQFVGMAKSLEAIPNARDLFEHASEVMGYVTESFPLATTQS